MDLKNQLLENVNYIFELNIITLEETKNQFKLFIDNLSSKFLLKKFLYFYTKTKLKNLLLFKFFGLIFY